MPRVTLRLTVDGVDESISEYICDFPDCPEPAIYVLDGVARFNMRAGLCAEHAARIGMGRRLKNVRPSESM